MRGLSSRLSAPVACTQRFLLQSEHNVDYLPWCWQGVRGEGVIVPVTIGQAAAWASPVLFRLLVRDQLPRFRLRESPSDSSSLGPMIRRVGPYLAGVFPCSLCTASKRRASFQLLLLAVIAFPTSRRLCLGIEPSKAHLMQEVECSDRGKYCLINRHFSLFLRHI